MRDELMNALTRIEALLCDVVEHLDRHSRARSLDEKHPALPASRLLSVKQVAKTLSLAEITVRKQLCKGSFPISSFTVGRRRVFRASDVEEYVRDSRGTPDAL